MNPRWRLVGKVGNIRPMYCGTIEEILEFYEPFDEYSCANLHNWYISLSVQQILAIVQEPGKLVHETPTYKLYYLGS